MHDARLSSDDLLVVQAVVAEVGQRPRSKLRGVGYTKRKHQSGYGALP